jgi:hypothetical protein
VKGGYWRVSEAGRTSTDESDEEREYFVSLTWLDWDEAALGLKWDVHPKKLSYRHDFGKDELFGQVLHEEIDTRWKAQICRI